ncbi:uncharacterized protein LOC110455241 [Mizuhopecten yessoensis]|uniref:Uncharacterized protein n=1 Tax=Mizuhopecten yessoensis TaxID=6573 RepID=A0A210QDE6_MIZYE|nr:uncharacterized protein LOC110455241 [Mizuhopecten yessoensis]OWF46760.1 hypothetical protein KP79_PYT18872 [Mizuhopecten yessoensis]
MTVEIQHWSEGSRAPPPPYLEALAYPLTAITKPTDNEKDTEENTELKKCPEIQDGGTSLYPIALLSNTSRSNSVCSGCSGVRSNSPLVCHVTTDHPLSCRGSCESCVQESSDEVTSFMSKKQCLSHNSITSNKLTGSPGSLQTCRSYSPQPGPSGYNGSKGKGRASSTVKFINGAGNYKTGATSDSSDNIYSTNCTTSLNETEEEPNNSAADRGTLYCACGILISIVTLVLLLVNFA